ncbi:CGGC domain-containing protein [Thermodesulfobacteriota bacterium]
MKPDVIHFSTCLSSAKLDCPYTTPENIAELLENKTGIKVVLGTPDYH